MTDSTQPTIVVVEDEPKIAELLRDYLAREGFSVTLVESGDAAVAVILQCRPVLVLLDLMLPGKDGIAICREVRQVSNVPIIMLTAKVDEIDRLLGLQIGADDYVCKPFSPREVVARVHTILRRVTQSADGVGDESTLSYRGVQLFKDRFVCEVTLSTDGAGESSAPGAQSTTVELTPVEFRLLSALMEAPGRVYSRDDLMRRCYTDGRIVSDRTIDSHVKNVRRKLLNVLVAGDAGDGATDNLIHSIYGVGYKIE